MLTSPEQASAMAVAVTWCAANAIRAVVNANRYLAYLKKAGS